MKKGDVLRAVPTHEQVLWEGEKQVQNLHTQPAVIRRNVFE